MNVVRSGIRIGGIDRLTQRAVEVAGSVIGVIRSGDPKRGGEGACGQQGDQKDQKTSRGAHNGPRPTAVGFGGTRVGSPYSEDRGALRPVLRLLI